MAVLDGPEMTTKQALEIALGLMPVKQQFVERSVYANKRVKNPLSKRSSAFPKDEMHDNPFQGQDGNWYWFDTYETVYGPFTQEIAEHAVDAYTIGHEHGEKLAP